MNEAAGLSFPDAPRADLDVRISELVRAANDVMATQGRLRALLQASQAVTTELDLPSLLQTIVTSAVELSGAQYGALGIVGPHGQLEQFIHVGIPPGVEHAIGALPRGEGLLGALIADPRPIRLNDLGQDARAVGFPAHHPPMHSFLGVPIRVRGAVYGNLYLTEHRGGEFTDEDEQLVMALASTAGFAVENARLFLETQQRQAWAAASAEVAGRILARSDGDAVSFVADRLVELADADTAFVALLSADSSTLRVDRVRGDDLSHSEGVEVAVSGSPYEIVIESGNPARFTTDQAREIWPRFADDFGPVLALPLHTDTGTIGAVLVARRAELAEFTEVELGMAADFAAQASVALALSGARADQERVAVFEDRGRIARDLHDHVIQQLFATGMRLQSVLGTLPPGRAAEHVDWAVGNLDQSIAQIRTIVFTLTSGTTPVHMEDRHRIVDLVGELATRLEVEPAVTFAGPIDLVLDASLADESLAVITELVTNAVKHARARDVAIRISADRHEFAIEVTNTGLFVDAGPRSGLANLEHRARVRGGSLTVDSSDGKTAVRWRTPLGSRAPADEHRKSGSA